MNQEPNDFFVFFVNSILLGLAFNKIAVEGSFENWRIVACKVFVDNNRLGLGFDTGVERDKLEGVPKKFVISDSRRSKRNILTSRQDLCSWP